MRGSYDDDDDGDIDVILRMDALMFLRFCFLTECFLTSCCCIRLGKFGVGKNLAFAMGS